MASHPVYKYIISKNLDPVFALGIGLAAAATRINREEKERGHSFQDTMDATQRRISYAIDATFGTSLSDKATKRELDEKQ